MANEPHVAPELDGLLRELAADPRSTMLRMPADRAARTVFERNVVLSKHPTGITVGERELLRAHRAEVAYLLRYACASLILTSTEGARWNVTSVRKNERIVPASPPILRRQMEEASSDRETIDREVSEVLASLVGSPRSELPSVAHLAAASMRLVPTAQARTYAALYEGHEGRLRSAERMHLAIAAEGASSVAVASSWTNAARAQFQLGRPDASIESLCLALSVDPSVHMAAVGLLHLALSSGMVDHVLRAANELDERLAITDYESVELVNFCRRNAIRAADRERASATAERVDAALGAVGRELIHAML